MKKITIIAFLIAMVALMGCNRSKSNGKIDGFWRVNTIENREDGQITEVGNRYFSVQLELFQLRNPVVTGVMNYEKNSDKLIVDFRDPNPEDPKNGVPGKLALYGIMENPVTFDVAFPHHDEMVLTSDETIIRCQRW